MNIKNFVLIDDKRRFVKTHNDFDLLQDLADQHNEKEDAIDRWFVISDRDYYTTLNEVKMRERNPNYMERLPHSKWTIIDFDQNELDYPTAYVSDNLARDYFFVKLPKIGWVLSSVQLGSPKPTSKELTEIIKFLKRSERTRIENPRKVTLAVTRAFLNREAHKSGQSRTDGKTLWLYDNAIAEWRGNSLWITNAGWDTKTTKERLNALPNVNIVQRNFQWYLNGKAWNGEWIKVTNENSRSRNNMKEVENISMGFYDATGFHPIRASYDYDEDRVGEDYRPRPVKKYRQKERAFLTERKERREAAAKPVRYAKQKQRLKKTVAKRFAKPSAKRLKPATKKRNTATRNQRFNEDKLDQLSGIFQGRINGNTIKTVGSDFTPALTARLGRMASMIIKNGGDVYEISFNGKDAWLSADARKNIYIEGRDGRIKNAHLPKKGSLQLLGEIQQLNYITDKQHIENGNLVEYYHKLGEVDGVKPNAFIDHDGFPIIIAGNYDIGIHGIEN